MRTKALTPILVVIVCLPVVLNLAAGAVMADATPLSTAKILRFGVHVSELGNLDPHFAAGSQDRAVADMIFNGILRYQPGNAPKIEPDLAETIPDFEMIDGRQVWTVKLRQGVMFHGGPSHAAYEMTADDVVFSLKKSARRETCAYAGEYEGMTVIATDRYTVQISVAEPMSAILFLPKLTNYAGGFIVSKRAIEAAGYDGFKRHPVGTGPFAFSRYTPGEELLLEAHDGYFRGRPLLDGVQVRFIPEINTRESTLIAGELDLILGSGEIGWPEKMDAERGITVDTHGVGEVATIYLNTQMEPLDDIRIRRAIALTLDRQAFLETTSKQLVGGVYSPVPARFLPGGLTKAEAEQLNLADAKDLVKARQLMADAGYPDGFSLNLVSSEKRLYRTYYEEMRKQLLQIGIDCRISVVTHANMHKQIRQDPKPIVVYVAWRPNADAYLSRFFHSDAIVVKGARPDTNFSHYTKVDQLIEAARLEIDPQKQTQLWVQAQIRILDDVAAFPIMYTKQCYARRDNLDYGHALISTMALYPQFTERTQLNQKP